MGAGEVLANLMPFVLRQPGDTANPLLARAYGKQSTRGLLAYFERAGDRTKGIWLLAQGGKYGCDGIDEVRYNGTVVAETDVTLQWKFHPGTKSTGYNDPLQGRPEFFPNINFCFSEICYLEVILPTVLSPTDPDEAPDGLEVFMRGLKVMQYTVVSGRLQESTAAFSANNALVSLDLLREVGKVSLLRFQRWAQDWKDFETRCDALISWDKGPLDGGVVSIPRFDAHVAFGQSQDPFSSFESILLRAPGVVWQDVNGGLRPLITPDRDPVHTFIWDPTQTVIRSNVVRRGLSITPRDPAEVPNFFIFSYRDLDDPLYKEKTVPIDRQELRDAVGGTLNTLGPIPLPGVMRQSLAERIGWYTSRNISGWDLPPVGNDPPVQVYPAQFEVKGKADSYKVAKGDNVDLAHEIIEIRNAAPLFCRVLKEDLQPKKGERSFTIQLTARDIYRDTDHSYTQGEGTVANLLATATVDLNSATKQTLYTVPTGKKCVITDVVVRNLSGTPVNATVRFGFDAGATDQTALLSLIGVLATQNVLAVLTNPKLNGTAAQIFGAKPGTLEGSALTCVCDVFGYIVAA